MTPDIKPEEPKKEYTREDVERLKLDWLNDPCYDLPSIDGFGNYIEELKAFQSNINNCHRYSPIKARDIIRYKLKTCFDSRKLALIIDILFDDCVFHVAYDRTCGRCNDIFIHKADDPVWDELARYGYGEIEKES